MAQEYHKARNPAVHNLRIARLELYGLVLLTTGHLSNSEVPICTCWVSCRLPPASLPAPFSAISLFLSIPSAYLPHCPPWCTNREWGCTGLTLSGQGTGKAKCLPSPQAPAGKEGQAPQNRKAGALGGGHIRDSSQEPELKSREAAAHNLHEKDCVHFSFS